MGSFTSREFKRKWIVDPKETQAHKEWGGGLNDEHGEIIL